MLISKDFEVKRRLVGSGFMMFMSERESGTLRNSFIMSNSIA